MHVKGLPYCLAAAVAAALMAAGGAIADSQQSVVEESMAAVPTPPWSAGDQLGMANTIGSGTWARCAYHLSEDGAKSYELSHLRTNTMPMSPFGAPLVFKFTPTVSLPGTRHAFNGEQAVGGEPGAQGTQMDAIGHFAYYDEVWTGEGDAPLDKAKYYGGFTQAEVKKDGDAH